MSDNVQPLNGQQLSALQQKFAGDLASIKKDVDLRKWAVDQACGLAGTAIEGDKKPVDVVATARAIHGFLTEAVRDAAI